MSEIKRYTRDSGWMGENPRGGWCHWDEVQACIRELEAALVDACDVIDQLMGDTDLDEDDSPEFRVMKRIAKLLGKEK